MIMIIIKYITNFLRVFETILKTLSAIYAQSSRVVVND